VGSDGRRDALVRARLDAVEQVATLTHHLRGVIDASRFTNADDEHDPEGSTIAFERAQLTALLMAARRRLADLDEVLRRFDEGSYGTCEACGRPIPAERLAARPSARTCVGCAEGFTSRGGPDRPG
jgi:RNA polymerase-binding transcription factor DksA